MQREIENLYQAYAHYRLIPDVAYCDHCITPDRVAALHAAPLRQAPAEHVAKLMTKHSTWGDDEFRYYRHFLPRILELVAAGELNDSMYAISLRLPLRVARTTGSPAEHAALDAFTAAWWAQTISDDAVCGWNDVFDVLVGSGWAVQPLLDALATGSLRRLSDFVHEAAITPDNLPEVAAWLDSGRPETLLRQAPADLDEDARLDIAETLAMLTATRAA